MKSSNTDADNVNDDIIDIVYNEGNADIDPSYGIIDSGCGKTVAGMKWIDAYVEIHGDESKPIKRKVESEKF